MAGCYGKIPALGDFLSRNLPATFVDSWDGWIRRVMASCARADDGWTERYLSAPIWRFALAPGTVGDTGRTGIMVPSVDRIGRCYPLTVVADLPAELSAIDVATAWEEGFERAEVLALGAIDRALDAETFVARVAALSAPSLVAGPADSIAGRWTAPPAPGATRGGFGVRMPGAPTGQAEGRALMASLALPVLAEAVGGYSLWWHLGWEDRPPATALFVGLPPPEAACGMLLGDWENWGWSG